MKILQVRTWSCQLLLLLGEEFLADCSTVCKPYKSQAIPKLASSNSKGWLKKTNHIHIQKFGTHSVICNTSLSSMYRNSHLFFSVYISGIQINLTYSQLHCFASDQLRFLSHAWAGRLFLELQWAELKYTPFPMSSKWVFTSNSSSKAKIIYERCSKHASAENWVQASLVVLFLEPQKF